MVRQTEPTRVVVWMMILALWAFMLDGLVFEEIRWENLDWPPCRISTRGGDRRIRVYGDGTALQILQPNPGFKLRFHFPVCGVLLSAWLLHEPLTWSIAIGTVCVGVGLVLIRFQKPVRG